MVVKIKEKSWHHWIVLTFSEWDKRPPEKKDFCSYVRHFVIALFFAGVISTVGALVIFSLCHIVWDLVYSFIFHEWHWDSSLNGVGLFVICLASVIAGLVGYFTARERLTEARRAAKSEAEASGKEVPPPPFIFVAYEALRGRLCFKIEVVKPEPPAPPRKVYRAKHPADGTIPVATWEDDDDDTFMQSSTDKTENKD